ncbi:MAG: thiamine phosphate synthase [Phycisphaerae bacterium]|nr:thiamine phosphate synthase [Phycisphaerae bacterium]
MSIPRVIDSSCNRLSEALRVMEDLARFILDDRELAAALKEMRHACRSWDARFPSGWLIAHRDAGNDVGTATSTTSEQSRSGPLDIAVAAGNRAAEALRSIEECVKTIDADLAAECEATRYRLYDLDARLRRRLSPRQRRQWAVCLLLTESACRRDWLTTASEAVRGGVDCIQLREKDLPDRVLLDRTRRLMDMAHQHGCSVIVNDRVDVALAAEADGVHLGQDDMALADARRCVGNDLLIGISTHGADEADAAVLAGADYCGVGPMFLGNTRPELEPAGPGRLIEFLERHPGTPHLAIGGVTPEGARVLGAAGCRGIAACESICGSEDPAGIVEMLRESMQANVEAGGSPA